MQVNAKLSRPNRQYIRLEGIDEKFHMMFVWNTSKPDGYKEHYKVMIPEFRQLLLEHNNEICFTPIFEGPNSTYGQVDEWLTRFIYDKRDVLTWINKEKDLGELKKGQTDDRPLFAHMSRRELGEESKLLRALKEETFATFTIKCTV